MPNQSHPANFVDLLDTMIELSCYMTMMVGTDRRTEAGDDKNPSAEEAGG